MPEQTPQPHRVTPESAARLVAIYAQRWGLTGRAEPAVDWTFTVSVVPGLSHPGPDGKPAAAWAVVLPQVNPANAATDLPGGSAHVELRDIDATPIPGFDGDPMVELRITVAHEMGHAVVAEAVASTGGKLTVPAEEHIVEAAAQALVRSEGTGDARVMARAVRSAVPSALRARISATASKRARGATMDPETIQKMIDALKAGDGESALKMCEEALVKAASGGAMPTEGGPSSDGAPKMADDTTMPADGAASAKTAVPPVGDPKDPAPPTAGRAVARGGTDVTETETKARMAGLMADMQRMHVAALPNAKAALITGARARLGADAISPATEKRIMAATSYARAEEILAIVEETPVATRARSGVEHVSAELAIGPSKALPVADLAKEGFAQPWITSYQATHAKDPAAAVAMLEGGRSGMADKRARSAQNGAAK